ncbi:hypothetical protein RFI_13253 [Reticulomyxa filosa]|uniref:Uncharacterized protein n=1 Tax=Reticulomyxa filosa TaxID=46433 RepID=X6ND74_RETFI|nr:hypothetical protein RFI_13253 [Reticulomyxa filosa]|eukprot:ETO23906.1 hypothetical protein RFI_13253 [Reticulomyxa filosa]
MLKKHNAKSLKILLVLIILTEYFSANKLLIQFKMQSAFLNVKKVGVTKNLIAYISRKICMARNECITFFNFSMINFFLLLQCVVYWTVTSSKKCNETSSCYLEMKKIKLETNKKKIEKSEKKQIFLFCCCCKNGLDQNKEEWCSSDSVVSPKYDSTCKFIFMFMFMFIFLVLKAIVCLEPEDRGQRIEEKRGMMKYTIQ